MSSTTLTPSAEALISTPENENENVDSTDAPELEILSVQKIQKSSEVVPIVKMPQS